MTSRFECWYDCRRVTLAHGAVDPFFSLGPCRARRDTLLVTMNSVAPMTAHRQHSSDAEVVRPIRARRLSTARSPVHHGGETRAGGMTVASLDYMTAPTPCLMLILALLPRECWLKLLLSPRSRYRKVASSSLFSSESSSAIFALGSGVLTFAKYG